MRQNPDIEISLVGEEATIDLGAKLALNLRAGDCISLIGDLGAGKTTLSRGLIQAILGADTEVPSPTYTIVQTYETDPAPIWHFDLYRLEDSAEIYELGIEEAFDSAICLIEWPEKMAGNAPRDWLEMRLNPGAGENSRRAVFTPHGARAERLLQRLGAPDG